MAREIYRNPSGSVSIDAYVGPERPDGGMRRRYQVTIISEQDGKHHSAYLTYEEFRELKAMIGVAH